jgi:HAD superfamily hydrolase (TIGR01459 family)
MNESTGAGMASAALPYYDGIGPLADRYDALLLDLWGVVHNGKAPFPGVVDCLNRLRAAGKRVVLLSNAPRSSDTVVTFLDGIGVEAGTYDRIVTSGDAARRALVARSDPFHARLGRTYYYLGKAMDRGMLAGTDYAESEDLADASFFLNLGLADPAVETTATYRPVLAAGLARGLPMVCGNPDLEVLFGDGMQECAGALAQAYAEMGGEVYWHGKPWPRVYGLCFEVLSGIPRRRILAIGDSLRTDIAGAAAAGIDSLFAVSGIHAREYGVAPGTVPDIGLVRRRVAAGEVRPSGLIATLRW